MRNRSAVVVAIVLLSVASVEATTARAQEAERAFAMGMTYWPSAGALTPGDVVERDLGGLLRNSEIIHIQVPWCPGQDLASPGWMHRVARETAKGLAISVDWLAGSRDGVRCGRDEPWTFADSSAARAFEREVAQLARRYRPDYLTLGVEVDHYAVAAPEDFEHFLRTFSRTRHRLDHVSSETEVGVSLQYEHALAVRGSSSTLLEDMLTAFEGMSDFIGLSVYPFKAGKNPEDVDAGYFDPMSDVTLPVAVLETAWPGGDAAQETYLTRILEASNALQAVLVFWTSMRDVDPLALGPGVPAWASGLGFWDAGGNPRPALDTWRAWLEKPRSAGRPEPGKGPLGRGRGVEGFGVHRDGAPPVDDAHRREGHQQQDCHVPARSFCP